MNRNIYCGKCKDDFLNKFGLKYSKELDRFVDCYPGEHSKIVKGKALRNYYCDLCGKNIDHDKECYAVSFWADYGGIQYYEWEHEYIY